MEILTAGKKEPADRAIPVAENQKKKLAETDTRKTSLEKSEAKEKPPVSEEKSFVKKETVTVHLDPKVWQIRSEKHVHETSDSAKTGQDVLEEGKDSALRTGARRVVSEKSGNDAKQERNGEGQKEGNPNLFSFLKETPASAQSERTSPEHRVLNENGDAFRNLVQKAKVNTDSRGNSSASINLRPEALGKLTMNLEMRGNVLEARLLVDSQSAKTALLDELESLRLELKSHGIQVENFQIRIRESASTMHFGKEGETGQDQGAMTGSEGKGDHRGFDEAAERRNQSEDSSGLLQIPRGAMEYETQSVSGNRDLPAGRINISI